ncbi:MAG: iron ABC transporter permease [Ruminococcaceae bacterium]|nr:iron ABC transporter permease [Oscillospiraceae bacterium]
MKDGRRRTVSFMKHSKNKKIYLYAASIALLLISILFGLLFGASEIGFSEVIKAIFDGGAKTPEARIIRYVRLPRVLGAVICGAALAVSGAVIQGVLANKLASPSIIGVNAGAGFAVTLCSAMGIVGGLRLSIFAFLGAFSAVLLVSLGARKWGASTGTVILMGVALNSLLGAMSDTVVSFIPDVAIMSSDFKIGDFSAVTYSKLIPAAFIVLISLLLLFSMTNELEVLSLGDESAKGLGMNTGLARMIFLLLSALLAGAAVTVCGLLSFVGLLVPHAVRRMSGGGAKHLLPLCALFGGGFVSLCDTLARVVFKPYEIPVGIIMAFLGAPFFLFILIKGRRSMSHD